MKRCNICVVKATLAGTWGEQWFFARILQFEEDRQGNWDVSKVQIIGESFMRDDATGFEGIYRITDADKQAAAAKLAAAQWGAQGYATLDAVRAAIISVCG